MGGGPARSARKPLKSIQIILKKVQEGIIILIVFLATKIN